MSEFADVLRKSHAAVKLKFTWFGIKKSLDGDQKRQAREVFNAKDGFLSASKKLLDTKHPAVKAVNGLRGEIRLYFRHATLPFPEDGVRLVKREKLTELLDTITMFVGKLDQAVAALNDAWDELKQQAKEELGELYDENDYPNSLDGKFSVTCHVVNTNPPDYLKETLPGVYRLEQERIGRQMEAAVALAEQSFTAEFAKMVGSLGEQLSGALDGKVKRFSKGHLENIKGFFERFKELDLGSNERLGQLVEQAQAACDGVEIGRLKESKSLQRTVAESMSEIGKQLEGMVELRPARAVSFDDEE